MTPYEPWIPAAKRLVTGLAGKPGVHFVDKKMVVEWVAQAMHGMQKRGELPNPNKERTD